MRLIWLAWKLLLVTVLAGGCSDGPSDAGPGGTFDAYPSNLCAGEKQVAAAAFCRSAFDAWAVWETQQDDDARDAAIAAARGVLGEAWNAAEARSADLDVNCADLATSASDAAAGIEQNVGSTASEINQNVDLGSANEASCGAAVLTASGTACADLLNAESRHVRSLSTDANGTTLSAERESAFAALTAAVEDEANSVCTPEGSQARLEAGLDALVDAAVLDTVVAQGLSDATYATLTPGPTEYEGRTYTPQCVQGSEYRYFARRGSVNKLLIYYQGGGACWNGLTCGIPTCRALPNDNLDEFAAEGFFDLDDDRNPFQDWNIIFVTYCTCDIHFGDASVEYTEGEAPAQHLGFHNAKVAEKWAREHFVNPEVVFVTGSSAGAYGAWFHGPLLHDVWPASQMHILADAGNGVITEEFLENEFSVWNFVPNLPEVEGVLEAITEGGGITAYTEAVANEFPDTNWAHYTAFYDGSPGGQSGFYNVMLNDGSPAGVARWWDASCEFGEIALSQSQQTSDAVPENYRYYFGSGSEHTVFRFPKVYDDTTGGVPLLVDWIDGMLASGPSGRDPAWVNVLCEDCGVLLEGDPRPDPLEAPFETRGDQTVVVCD
ncbi:MAG: pectin acetylesterase-family hydrolase [Myxococcota bacterium]